MKRIIMVFAFLAVTLSSLRLYASHCPPDMVCLTHPQAEEVLAAVEAYNCMIREAQGGKILYTVEPDQIVVSKEGQVFTKEHLVAKLEWCEWSLELKAEAKTVVLYQGEEEPKWGFRVRVRIGAALSLPLREGVAPVEPLLALEPFFLYDIHVLAYGGLRYVGVGLGVDLFRNLNVFGGVSLQYQNWQAVPTLGMSLSFN